MHQVTPPNGAPPHGATAPDEKRSVVSVRIKSQDLFLQGREVEIDHAGRIYRLRLTQLNKLILTA